MDVWWVASDRVNAGWIIGGGDDAAFGCLGRAARGVRPTAGATNFYGPIGIGINQTWASDRLNAGWIIGGGDDAAFGC
ncbi:hypothetical protein, partial [Stenotrophomonas sp. CCNWLW57]|uniref:hypothetical protein n=1 Tax=Stenotrophomonas sp. CCNWLW57 TaxID=3127478 RepID=UPI00307766FF